ENGKNDPAIAARAVLLTKSRLFIEKSPSKWNLWKTNLNYTIRKDRLQSLNNKKMNLSKKESVFPLYLRTDTCLFAVFCLK
ncbi:MAG: hypothetical protein Q4G69_12765, partial [Planctomycetia bacterium]|nr:hypothetical protein [Planctomycetia bacterium]